MKLFILALLALTLTSCGKDDSGDPAPVVEEDEEVTLTRTTYLLDDQKDIDQCDVFEINDTENCYIEHARLDIYSDGSLGLEVRWFHIASDGSNDEGETFVQTSEPDADYVAILIDEDFSAYESDGKRVWVVARKRPKITHFSSLALYHDDDNTATLDLEADQPIDSLNFDD